MHPSPARSSPPLMKKPRLQDLSVSSSSSFAPSFSGYPSAPPSPPRALFSNPPSGALSLGRSDSFVPSMQSLPSLGRSDSFVPALHSAAPPALPASALPPSLLVDTARGRWGADDLDSPTLDPRGPAPMDNLDTPPAVRLGLGRKGSGASSLGFSQPPLSQGPSDAGCALSQATADGDCYDVNDLNNSAMSDDSEAEAFERPLAVQLPLESPRADALGDPDASARFLSTLGTGAFGSVSKVRCKIDSQLYAIKSSTRPSAHSSGLRTRQLKEVNALAMLAGSDHARHIVR
ncbi:hypothetical protein TeGR_g14545 [Tetraparma gracilis]|uniref:Protein kinase domain-containing protein n=1 Tax=Tetraparma gracilis TaxID=2962635 RepID=A0ABQ6M6K1_9STRA|nr:hypothetical protein TeGR_g14545 [Tetraparma gracilis]